MHCARFRPIIQFTPALALAFRVGKGWILVSDRSAQEKNYQTYFVAVAAVWEQNSARRLHELVPQLVPVRSATPQGR